MKDRIKKKSHDLFMQYGVKSVTMDEIAVQMGVSKKTIYQYYADKDELVDAVVADILMHNHDCCLRDKKQAKDAIHEVFLAMDMMQEMFQDMNPGILFELEKYYPKAFEKFKQHKYSFLHKMLRENIERGISEELYRSEINADILIKMRLETMMIPFNQAVFPKTKYDMVKVANECTFNFIFGMATTKGHKLIIKYQQDRTKKKNSNENILA
ncbi:MAG: TetR/AcrR family transcriptional regulator [Bacteroidetes bacterium]|nr:TetR/AcrR family transcriptional regulator [Bacteroidota bacterium]